MSLPPRVGRLALSVGLAAAMIASPATAAEPPLEYQTQQLEFGGVRHELRLPKGYVLEVLATPLDKARMPSFGANGDLILGSRSGKIFRLPPPYRSPQVLVELDKLPHSVALREGELLIGRTDGIYRAPYRPGQDRIEPGSVSLLARLPAEGPHHMTRTVGVGPEGRVYVSLGMTGNCGDNYLDDGSPFETRRGGIFVLDESGTAPALRAFAAGLRNPVGFAWHPTTRMLHATNNGPDHWGFERPPEYLSRVEAGSFHGMPWFQFDGEQLRRDSCIESEPPRPLREVEKPVATFAAHQAPLGIAFVPEGAMDPGFSGDAIVALHGSWITPETADPATRRPPKLVVVRFQDGQAQGVEDLVTGFQLEGGKRWARPVGVAFGPDRALYITSDRNPGALFRLRRAE
jgi:glucose/arabinose dehydrogenase